MICNGCNGKIGKDCFNPPECEAISRDMAMREQAQQFFYERGGDALIQWVEANQRAIAALLTGTAAVVPVWKGEHGTYLGKKDMWGLRVGNTDLEEFRLDQPLSDPEHP